MAMTSNPRRQPSVSVMRRLIAELQTENDRLRAQLEPPHFVPIKAAEARGYSPETVRRWCQRKLVKHRWDGTRLLVDQTDLTARCNRLSGKT
jgi:hypothetical protein